ncbi:MAG TPA: class 1 isoprenoid biosynthesis enzyme [Clostridiales bacterium]|nr:class 1 isoprenoid biosynthesis enzyme [Clostridiales bacterium]
METNMAARKLDIGRLREICIRKWDSTPDVFPVLYKRYTDSDHAANNVRIRKFIDDFAGLVRGFDGKPGEDHVRWGSCLKKLVYDCGVNVAGFDDPDMRLLLDGGFCDATSDFIEQARTFDISLKLDDIFQALRNVWIMNCIQVFLGQRVRITPSVFAYSMLYPYTDNFLDAGSISGTQKQDINSRLEKKLAGERVISETPLENRLFRLVEMIEGQYDRKLFPMVYESLLGIHGAQVRSMRQDIASPLPFEEIKDISAEKGGCSVLADGCLVKGRLSENEATFIFCFGMLLQLVDDLQDAADDRKNGHKTLFTANGGGTSAKGITNKLINFTFRLFDNDGIFAGSTAIRMKKVIKDSIILLVMAAAASNSSMYEKTYLKDLEEYSPVDFKTLLDCRKRINREYAKLKIKLTVKPLEVQMAKAFAAGTLD